MRYKLEALDDDIAALATPPGLGLEAIIRGTGPGIILKLTNIISPEKPCRPSFKKGIQQEEILLEPGVPIRVKIYFWPGPNSYTGQQLIEIHFPAVSAIATAILDSLSLHGVRLAKPGEFTLRGFLAGKIDISQVEAIHNIIEATDRAVLEHALSRLAGGMLQPLKDSREDLLNLLADVEANLDFAHEDISFIGEDDLLRRITNSLAKITLTIKKISGRSIAGSRSRVVLTGRPNVGKSTLFNSLLGAKSALVSPIPGSTRDFVQAPLEIGGIELFLVDTPGIESSSEELAANSQVLAQKEWDLAHIIVFCAESEHELQLERFRNQYPGKPFLTVGTKADLLPGPNNWINVSSLTKSGIDQLRGVIIKTIRDSIQCPINGEMEKTHGCCKLALENLKRAHHLVLFNEPIELLALELREAIENLGMVLGQVYTEDLLDRMFSRFCVGK